MLYKNSHTSCIDPELFKNPTSEYRAAPFWAWNCELCSKELLRQIECLKAMGFGGFYMHTRSGMTTPYLSEEFMQLVKECTKKAKSEKMLAWLYDEDRWPSGAAGGFVTKNPEFRQRQLVFTTHPTENMLPKEQAIKEGKPYFLGMYDVVLNSDGELKGYKQINSIEHSEGDVWYAYVDVKYPNISGWHNGEAYVDTLNPYAVRSFLDITHEAYKRAIGDEFGVTVPAFFTDEPQFATKKTLPFAKDKCDAIMPWTNDFDMTYKETYGIDIVSDLPELFWELGGGEVSQKRYYYHDHICERFTTAFVDQIGAWCDDNNLLLTGHMMAEWKLSMQTACIGEAMRAYRSFSLPGIDMLCNRTEFSTAKQAQSAARQYGREGVMSELYGVTNWDFDFRGHKFQGDWQAALGVTARVPHLSWVSMKGSAKRDYPASMNYQAPWYKEYSYIEDHYARLAVVLTRGKPCVRVGVIHPIESYWLHWGPTANTSQVRMSMEERFHLLIKWLLFGTIDFDFINESGMVELCAGIEKRISIGEMNYDVILVPACETLRKSTVDILSKFVKKGGKVIFAGECPKYVDAKIDKSDCIKKLWEKSIHVSYDKQAILTALADERDIEIKDSGGNTREQFFYQMRCDGDNRYLFIANVAPVPDDLLTGTQPPVKAIINVKGEYTPIILDTLSGTYNEIGFEVSNGKTAVYYDFHENDSLLLCLQPCTKSSHHIPAKQKQCICTIDFKENVCYEREEDNVCLLDIAAYSLNDGSVNQPEEILRADRILRQKLGWPLADGRDVQPWALPDEEICDYVKLYFKVHSEEEFENIYFCAEELNELVVNGMQVQLSENGYYVDKAIKKYELPALRTGENTIVAKVPFTKRISLEPCYLTGDFDVRLQGCLATLVKKKNHIGFGSITSQGMPFYGGNITYRTYFKLDSKADITVNVGKYAGALTRVYIDGCDAGAIVFAPYELGIRNVSAGEHILEFKLFGNRYNTFGPLHFCGYDHWSIPRLWYSEGNSWCYEYNVIPTGILKSPVIQVFKKQEVN